MNSLALITGVTALDLIGDQRREPLVARHIVLLAVLVSTFALLGQGVLASVVGPSATSLRGVPRVQQASAILLVVVTMLWHIGLLLMISERLQNRLLLLAERDGLTGVLNRAGFERLGQRQVERCHRSGSASTVLMMDLDYFKQVNDRYGHLSGDACLRHAAQRIQHRIEIVDIDAPATPSRRKASRAPRTSRAVGASMASGSAHRQPGSVPSMICTTFASRK